VPAVVPAKSVSKGASGSSSADQSLGELAIGIMLKEIGPEANLSSDLIPELGRERDVARKTYHEMVPPNLRPLIENYKKAIDKKDLADRVHEVYMNKYFFCNTQEIRTLDDLIFAIINLDSVNPKIVELANLALVFKRIDDELNEISEEIPQKSFAYNQAKNAIKKAIFNPDLAISPDLSPLIEYIQKYKTAVKEFADFEIVLDAVCNTYYDILDSITNFHIVYDKAKNRFNGSFYFNSNSSAECEMNFILRAYNRFLDAKNMFEHYQSIARLRACSREMIKFMKFTKKPTAA
jgi:hypothetical protein